MTTPAAARHLILVIRYWPDLVEALGSRSAPTWPPAGRMADYIRDLDQRDADEQAAEHQRAAELRLLERDPAQLGERPVPIRLTVFEVMGLVQADLIECADQIASSVQRPVMSLLGDGYPAADRRRRELLVMQDRRDPRRWSWTSRRATAPLAALWLLGRVQGAPGPFSPLTALQLDRISAVARTSADRVERALDIGEGVAQLSQPCPQCDGRINLHGGAGAQPVARCTGCGQVWMDSGAITAAQQSPGQRANSVAQVGDPALRSAT